MSDAGYYRFPTLHKETLVFVSEADLWSVSFIGGTARQLTSGRGSAFHPALSPDGKWISFTGTEEGPNEVYCMPATGGPATRLTFLGVGASVVGWTRDGRIVYESASGQAFGGLRRVYAISCAGGEPEMLPTGPASAISFGPTGGMVIARPSSDPASWKRYRGGTAGDLWIDELGDGAWRRLIKLDGNPTRPMRVGQRIYFLSDHEGIGNLYSCTLAGQDLRRHTDHDDFYARNAATDGSRIVYHAGGDLFLFDPATNRSQRVPIDFHSTRTQRNRKFIDAARYLNSFAVHPKGYLLAMTVRGKVASMGHWDGPVTQHGEPNAGRYRLAVWLNDGKRLVAVNDSEGEETLVVFPGEDLAAPQRLEGLDLARVVSLSVSPVGDQVVLSNVRNELILVDIAARTARVLDRSKHTPIFGFDVSPDGKWVAYAMALSLHTAIIKLCRLEDGATFDVTRPVLQDLSPVFDPDGKYLYFLSRRDFDPVYDNLHFDLSFPKGMRPYLVTLRKELLSPFALSPKPAEEKKPDAKPETEAAPAPFRIDLDGIADRVIAFPVPEAIYWQLDAIKGKALFVSAPVEGALNRDWLPGEPPSKGTLEAFDFETARVEPLVREVSYFGLSQDRKTLVYRSGNRVRVLKAGEKSDDAAAKEGPGRKSGWIDLKRVRIAVTPIEEWRQMFGEAWRLQRDQFWVADMADVDWQGIYNRYHPLLDRVSTRGEFSDVLSEMQGELGSSHAYSMGGDYREEPTYSVGYLGADYAWDASTQLWKIARIIRGDAWADDKGSPLLRPGVNVTAGDTILAINGRRTSATLSPAQLLVQQSGLEVSLTVADARGENPRTVSVKTIKSEGPARYRDWVEQQRAWVHEQTAGRCGYVHVPDMGARGYAEFHRSFLAEVDREGLLIDVRFNGGGHVSALLLEKLARRRLAYVQTRWFGIHPWPDESPAGPMVALTNEYAGSDGDIFSHNFKAMKLGPLIGKRTWGGVIGIWPRHTLADGGVTTQPEFSFWFQDVGWKIENYGVDPDIEVEFRPQDYVAGADPQLRRGVDELMKQLAGRTLPPDLGPRPSRARPKMVKI